jgi:Ca2+-binding RTX toxin-like protein
MVVLKNKALLSIMLAVLMAAGLLVAGLLASVKPAQATFPGDNGRIAFTSDRGGAFQIYSVSSTGREVDLNPVTTQLSGADFHPVYSPDGTKIAFQRTVAPAKANIWTISSSGGQNTNQITDNIASDVSPDWQSLPTGGGGGTPGGGGGTPSGCTITGTPGNDNNLVGTNGPDVICGYKGNDNLKGLQGNDTLRGGRGRDSLDTQDGVNGNDTAKGGKGSDSCTTDPGDTKASC